VLEEYPATHTKDES